MHLMFLEESAELRGNEQLKQTKQNQEKLMSQHEKALKKWQIDNK